MKIILSRKGLDGGFNGAKPSPIMPCGRLLSLPIPVTPKQMANGEDGIPYADLRFDGQSIRKIIDPLHKYKFNYSKAHLDPDLDRDRLENRRQGWRPAFGQVGPPQTLLENVNTGDLFLFFGWFRRTRYDNGELQYLQPRKCGKDLHVIFGWLQVGQRINPVTEKNCPCGLEDNLHVRNADAHGYGRTNTIYITADELIVSGQRLGVRGAGSFPCFKSSLQLTAPKRPRAHWCLPEWLCRGQNHGNWQCNHENYLPFDSSSRKQEFVFNMPEDPKAIEWLKGLFEDCY
ncbi:MAG: hypothetical protein A2Z38_03110 [Planctomycetes bacterium RBG_19FT_COMBO_48_8]|nr:MAG: hypothetical protein A2Z38_03110 [Planctomycetes bacterium RBG_19FT_COMBO_48_8]